MKQFLTSLLIIASLVFGMTGCPKTPKTVRDFREKSAELSTYGRRIITAIGEATLAGEISKAQLAALNPITGGFVRGVGTYRTLLNQAESFLVKGQPVPPDLLGKIARSLQSDVEATFFAITDQFKLLSPAANERVKAVFESLRLLVTSLRILFSQVHIEHGSPYKEGIYGFA